MNMEELPKRILIVDDEETVLNLLEVLVQSMGFDVVEKGSITLDGVSLTVARVVGPSIEVALVPVTLEKTTLGILRSGDPINVETDLLGKHVRRLLSQDAGVGSVNGQSMA